MKLKKLTTLVLTLSIALYMMGCNTKSTNQKERENMNSSKSSEDYYIFTLSENGDRKAVEYTNRYGIRISGDLYTAKNLDTSVSNQAIVIGSPYGGVKEQGAGIYANELAQRGFVVLTFDASFNGESAGEPRHVSSPDIFAEDFSAGVDYLGTLNYVDREKIGAIGICGSGGFALSAAQVDTRIKAIATSVMYDISSVGRDNSEEQQKELINSISKQRWIDIDNGYPEYIPSFPEQAVDSIPAGLGEVEAEFFSFYGLKRGHHPRARANFTTTSTAPFMNFQSLNYISSISPRPILFITGSKAHSRYFSDRAFKAANNPKELYVVEGANHVDLYDRVDLIPFDKLTVFFKDNLK